MSVSFPLYRLSKYLESQDCSDYADPVPKSLLLQLPTPYAATRVFGLELLNIHGKHSIPIKNLFCIRTYALEYGIQNAILLICNKTFPETNTDLEIHSFPKIYFECCNSIPKQFVGLVADLEKIRLCYELSYEIAQFSECVFPTYLAKDYRNRCTFRYLKQMCFIMDAIETISSEDESNKFYKFCMNHLEYMLKNSTIRAAHIYSFNLEERLNYREIIALTEATRNLNHLRRYVSFIYKNL
jgi:hypothetical protein